jgi:hypothetical protein
MTTLKGQAELDQYKLTRREVADYLGITTNAVRMSQRGKNCHNLEYRFDGKQFLFKVPRRDLVPSMIKGPLVQHSGTPKSTLGKHKKIYNRGATARGEDNYTSNALRMHNEAKMRIALDKKFKSPEHKKVFMDMSEAGFNEAYEISKRAKLKGTQENSRVSTPEVFPGGNPNSIHQSHGKYGHMLNAQGIAEGDRKAFEREDRKFEEETGTKYKQEWRTQERLDGTKVRVRVSTGIIDFGPSNNSYFTGKAPGDGYSGGDLDDPGSAEVPRLELSPGDPNIDRQPISKVRESILRLEIEALKKNK